MTAYHPQTKGLVERLNRTLTYMISMYVDVEHHRWDEILHCETFAYNTATQEMTRLIPFQLVFGRQVPTPLDTMLPVDRSCNNDTDFDVAIFVQLAKEARQLARLRIHRQQVTDATRYNLG